MAQDNTFQIIIDNFEGLAPAYYSNSWSSYGNKGSANSLKDVDISDPSILTQGAGLADITGVTTLISSIMKNAVSNDATFAVGENKVYKLTPSSVVLTGGFPVTIDKEGVTAEKADDIVYYNSYLYAFYNHSGSLGDIAKITPSNGTIDPIWGSSNGGTLNYAPHYAIVGGNDMVGFTNGRFIGLIDGDTMDAGALDLPENSQADTISWNGDYFIIGLNSPVVTGANYNQSAVYFWDGFAPSWNIPPVSVNGKIGAIYTHNGVSYIWYKDNNGVGGSVFGYINGNAITPIKRFNGELPNQNQICNYFGFIAWLSSNEVFVWGAGDNETPVKFFKHATNALSTDGALSTPFNELLMTSYEVIKTVPTYKLSKASGYSTNAKWDTIVFNLTTPNSIATIDNIIIVTEKFEAGGKLDTKIAYNQNKIERQLEQINNHEKIHHQILNNAIIATDFKLELDWSNGSTTKPVKVRGIYISGHFTAKNGTF